MYAITFDIDTSCVESSRGTSYNAIYGEIRKIMESRGFKWQQGSTYFGGDKVNAVSCVLVAQELAKSVPGFQSCVRDIRMLRIEEMNDLMPVVRP